MIELKINPDNPEPDLIRQAAETIKAGGIVAFPTDTVYGLGVDLFNEQAVERLFKLKGRPAGKGLIAMVADPGQLSAVGKTTPADRRLIHRFWPGPLTLVVAGAPAVPDPATVNGTVGVRMPGNRIALELIKAAGVLATTSANLSGRPTAKSAGEVKRGLGELVDVLIDGGPCAFGIESTVVNAGARPPKILREGAISTDEIGDILTY